MGSPTARYYRAYNPSDRGSSVGSDHIVLDAALVSGRLRRSAGDALCKPSAKFWGLTLNDSGEVYACRLCSSMARRHGVEVKHG